MRRVRSRSPSRQPVTRGRARETRQGYLRRVTCCYRRRLICRFGWHVREPPPTDRRSLRRPRSPCRQRNRGSIRFPCERCADPRLGRCLCGWFAGHARGLDRRRGRRHGSHLEITIAHDRSTAGRHSRPRHGLGPDRTPLGERDDHAATGMDSGQARQQHQRHVVEPGALLQDRSDARAVLLHVEVFLFGRRDGRDHCLLGRRPGRARQRALGDLQRQHAADRRTPGYDDR
jgi:hypothetical protein